jgi:hypothetical protein
MGARVAATVHVCGGNVPPPPTLVAPPVALLPLPPVPVRGGMDGLLLSTCPVQAANAATDSVSAIAERGFVTACMTTFH